MTSPPDLSGYQALAADYDGTIATEGKVGSETWTSLERLKAAGKKLILVTGRHLEDLQRVCQRLSLFDLLVVENGALIYDVAEAEGQRLAKPPPDTLIKMLRDKGVTPLVTGQVMIGTQQPYGVTVEAAIAKLGIPWRIILNKGAVMVMPIGIDKASGLLAAVRTLNLTRDRVIGVGDGENDLDLFKVCGFSVAVANALPEVKQAADWVTDGECGEGVCQICESLMANR